MAYFKIGSTDFSGLVSGLKVGHETLVSEDSGRNANGDTVLDVINEKYKLYVTFRPMSDTEMKGLMDAIADFVVSVTFLDPRTKAAKTITCYHGTPEPEYYTIQNGFILFKKFSFNFIEM